MGVLYTSADDVTDLLIPYLRAKGSTVDKPTVEQLYRECSLGLMSSAQFWDAAGTVGAADEEYCLSHHLTEGLRPLLTGLRAAGHRLACLSNDVAEWSLILRRRFGLTNQITDWVISGEIGVRKPDPAAYTALCRRLQLPPHRILFIDDRQANIAGARNAGFQAIQYGITHPDSAASMHDLATQLQIGGLLEC